MACLKILVYPDQRLRRVAQPVVEFNPDLKRLVADMAETMYAAGGIGLAATQVNVPLRVVVMDLSTEKNDLKVFINPRFSDPEGNTESDEGCLSVPGVYDTVQRAQAVQLHWQNVDGREFSQRADDLLAICIQHEIDHLDGKVFVDYLSRMKQQRIGKKLRKEYGSEGRTPVPATSKPETAIPATSAPTPAPAL